MEEETLYDRIGEADLNPTYKDGQVYQHTDVNNMVSILKTAVNENYHDIIEGSNKFFNSPEGHKYIASQILKAMQENTGSDYPGKIGMKMA